MEWSKEFPKVDGYYWWSISGDVRLLEVILGQREAWTQGDAENQWDKAYYWTGKFLGPITPAQAEQTEALRTQLNTAADLEMLMRDEISALRKASEVALKWMDWWLDSELCECDGYGHVCGKTERKQEADALRRALGKE